MATRSFIGYYEDNKISQGEFKKITNKINNFIEFRLMKLKIDKQEF